MYCIVFWGEVLGFNQHMHEKVWKCVTGAATVKQTCTQHWKNPTANSRIRKDESGNER